MKLSKNKNLRFESVSMIYFVKVNEDNDVYVQIKKQGEVAWHCEPTYYRDMNMALNAVADRIDRDNLGNNNEIEC